ncbi:MAG: molybdopterin-dependent oxidoreductase [Thermodesulfobacteriota bacterium]|nr:molybdopterin-dependent oxidoreductase [Thermodesulfobacteriota bacterium]
MEKISLNIDGKLVDCVRGMSILEAAGDHGINIPTLCHHPDLKPFGACRLCLVEDEKSGRVMASCVTPAAQNMVVLTDSPRIKKHRRNVVRLMMAEHPESCIFCVKGNRCQLRQIAGQLGVGETDLYPMSNYKKLEQANPFIVRDLSKCILCGKCIRADHELVVMGAIDYHLRGFQSRPSTVHDLALENSHCSFCGTCVSMCPTGALSTKTTCHVGTPQREALSICGFCGVGCSLLMGVVGDRIVEVNPSHLQDTVNGATLCIRGHFAHDFLHSKERLLSPMIRKEGSLVTVTWDEALEVVADRLLEIKRKHSPQNMAFLGSSKCTNEENYLFQKMARVVFGTNNVDNGGYMSGQSLMNHINEKIGSVYNARSLEQLEHEEVLFVLGANPSESNPVLSYYLKRAARNGTPLIVADPRQTELVNFSSNWLNVLPEKDMELINALASLLYKNRSYDPEFIIRFTEGFDQYRKGLSSLDPDKIARLTGVDLGTLEEAATLLQGKKIAFVIGHGILQQKYGLQSLDAILNLGLMTGSLGPQGAGLYVLSRENNQMGAGDMGAVPYALPGCESLENDTARKVWEQAWHVEISPDQGLNMVRMVEEAEKGNLKSLYIMGENPLRSLPQPDRVRKALEKLDFIVIQDILSSEIMEIADVVLPAAAFSEKAGSFTNMEGRIQTFKQVVPAPGDAKPDWEILNLLTLKLGYENSYGSLEKVKEEIIRLIPMYKDSSRDAYASWVQGPSEIPLSEDEGLEKFISFSSVISTEEEPHDMAYPLTAIFGSLRYHLGSGTRTSCSDRISEFHVKGEIGISPGDAEECGLHDGNMIRILSPHGSIKREIKLESGLANGQIFIPTAFNANEALNLLAFNEIAGPDSSGLKKCKVRIERV